MATKCLFKILDQIYLFPQRSQKNWKLESFYLNGDQVPFQNTLSNKFFYKGHKRMENWKAFTRMATKCLFKILDQIYLFPQRSQKNWKLEGFHLNGDQVYCQNTLLNLFISTKGSDIPKVLFKVLLKAP